MAHSKKKPLAPVRSAAIRLRVGRQGRLVIPAELRRRLDLHDGDDLLASAENGHLVLRRDEEIDERLWAMFRDDRGSMTDELLKDRRTEAAREKEG